MKPNRLDLYSPFPPEECLRLLEEQIALPPVGFLIATHRHKQVLGKIEGFSFWLRKRTWLNGLSYLCLNASLEPLEGGSRILGTFSRDLLSLALMACGFIFFALGGCQGLHDLAYDQGSLLKVVMVTTIVITIFYGIERMFRLLFDDSPEYFSDFLRTTLRARDTSTGEPTPVPPS